MNDIASVLPEKSPTVEAIFQSWKDRGDAENRRQYLGMSSIGKECERQLWYTFRHAADEEFEGRMYRLFERGHREEEVFANDLRAIGCDVQLIDEAGNQIGFSAVGGHFKGHMDAKICGVKEAPQTPHVGEFKTHSAKSFNKLTKEGVQKSKPEHYAQMQSYMRYSGMTRSLYLAVNKDDDDLYSERIRYDADFAGKLEQKAERIITASQPPTRIADRRDDFRCQFCPAKDLCHGSPIKSIAVPIKSPSCRQCCHATPALDGDGRWTCSRHNIDLDANAQETTCPSLLLLPGFITFADPIEAGKNEDGSDWIEFRNLQDGAVWRHGPDREAGQYSALDLIHGPAPVRIKENESLLDKYILDRASVAFRGKSSEFESRWRGLFKSPVPEPIAVEEGDGFTACEFPGGYLGLFSSEDMELRYLQSPTNALWRELIQ